MRSLPFARSLATAAAVAGATLVGVSLSGMASVDSELAASATPAPAARFDRVVYVPRTAAPADCPRPSRSAPADLSRSSSAPVDARPEL